MFDVTALTNLLRDHSHLMWWIAACSGLVFVASLILVPWLVVRIPPNYFASEHRPKPPFADRHPVLRWTGLILKNLLGFVLVIAGIAMLLLPGQGLLTIAMGVLLLNFPGKHKLEGKVISFSPVRRSINWLRRRAHVPPLRLRSDDESIDSERER